MLLLSKEKLKAGAVDISFVIPSYRTENTLPGTLAALASQTFDGTCEILVVDCSESDRVRSICSDHGNVRYLREKERFSPGIGRNLGARKAKGQLLVFLDADVILAPNAAERLWHHYRLGKKFFGGALELEESCRGSFPAVMEHLFFNHENHRRMRERRRKNLSSALLACDRACFNKHGGFCDIPRMQDTEFTERLVREGEELFHCPDIVGYQIQDSPMAQVLGKAYICGQNLYVIRFQKRGTSASRIMFLLLLPLLTILKMTRINYRNIRYAEKTSHLRWYLDVPTMYFLGLFWMAGFYRALIRPGRVNLYR